MISFKNYKKSDISIIILLYKTPLKKIQNILNYRNFKLLILDQSNDFLTKKKIQSMLPNIEYYHVSNNNKGFAGGINFLTSKVKTKLFLCTQLDVLLDENSIIELLRSFNTKRDCIISIPITNHKNNKKNNSKKVIKKKQFIGSTFLANKLFFDKLGKFDENFFFYWEDIDLSMRIQKSKRYKIYQCKNSFATHLYGTSTLYSIKSNYIRMTNFKFGEYFIQYKYKKLKKIKILREPILRFFYMIIFFLLLKKNDFLKNFFFLIGIFKFYVKIISVKFINLK